MSGWLVDGGDGIHSMEHGVDSDTTHWSRDVASPINDTENQNGDTFCRFFQLHMVNKHLLSYILAADRSNQLPVES